MEIGIDGEFGGVCAVNWQQGSSRVLCRSLGYVDGVPIYPRDDDLPYLPPHFSFFLCDGDEDSMLACLNSGFDGGAFVFMCGGDAYTQCYQQEISK